MITITITEGAPSHGEMAELLRHIADLIDRGNTSGLDPAWETQSNEDGASDTIVNL